MTLVIPTLTAGAPLEECLAALQWQKLWDFEVVVVDNSGKQLVRQTIGPGSLAVVLELSGNLGFGAAINEGFRRSRAPYLATLNDDAVAYPDWLRALLAAMEARPEVGMCASQVRLADEESLDSAGMLISADGSSKQRGHREPPVRFSRLEEVLLPSGSAALYRRAMLEEIGLFDEDFFLYCEDTDLGLRARWAGWKCLYVPEAIVEHRYSGTAGRASPLKAYYVERNRLFVIAKNFPVSLLARAPGAAIARYFWHVVSVFQGRGAAAQFRRENGRLLAMAYIVLRAHCAALANVRRLWRKRRAIRRTTRLSPREFCRLVAGHSITPRQVAAL